MEWGQQFHRLMERYLLGLSISPWLDGDRELANCFEALQQAFPDLVDSAATQLCEHRRSLQMGPYLLTVVYDLLILEPERTLIIDWKTAARPRDRARLEQDWQTQLYLYLLAETSPQPPDSLAMAYWFVRSSNHGNPAASSHSSAPDAPPFTPTVVQFNYTARWHNTIRDALATTLEQLTRWRQDLLINGRPFPQVSSESPRCIHCTFAPQCDRAPQSQPELLPSRRSPSVVLPPWETIPEINPQNL